MLTLHVDEHMDIDAGDPVRFSPVVDFLLEQWLLLFAHAEHITVVSFLQVCQPRFRASIMSRLLQQ